MPSIVMTNYTKVKEEVKEEVGEVTKVKDQTVVSKTGSASKTLSTITLTKLPVDQVMMSAGKISSWRTLLVRSVMMSAGNPSMATSVMTMKEEETEEKVKDQTVVMVTGTVLTPGLLKTLMNSHANLKMMTNAGGNGLRRTLPAVTKTTSAGSLSLSTTLVRTKKDKKTDPNLKDHHATLVTGTALTAGPLRTLTNFLVPKTMRSAGSDGSLRTLPAKKRTVSAGCPSLSTTSLKRRTLLNVLLWLHQGVRTKTGDVKKLGS